MSLPLRTTHPCAPPSSVSHPAPHPHAPHSHRLRGALPHRLFLVLVVERPRHNRRHCSVQAPRPHSLRSTAPRQKSRKELAELEQADLKSGRMVSLDPRHQFRPPVHVPVDYVPPHLPAGRIVFDGSILPPKENGATSLLRAPGFHPGTRSGAASYPTSILQNFSIA